MTSGGLLSVSVDYSEDELDAIAEAFLRPDLARRAPGDERHGPVRRAVLQSALRSLVARRAIRLDGTAARPQITFLEPHATLLGAFVGADAALTIRHERRRDVRAVSFFARDDAVVEQRGLPEVAIQRMVAHPVAAAADVAATEVDLGEGPDPDGRSPLEVTRRQFMLAIDAVEAGDPRAARVPDELADLLYARIGSSAATLSTGLDGTRVVTRWAWLDAGQLGAWRVVGAATDPVVRLEPAVREEIATDIAGAWTEALYARVELTSALEKE